MNFGGLIAGALGGAAKGYGYFAQSELKKQQEVDLRQSLMEVEFEKDQRIKEADLMRTRSEEARRMSPEYLEQVGQAELTKGQITARNRQTLAPDIAAAVGAEYAANKPNEDRKFYDQLAREGSPEAMKLLRDRAAAGRAPESSSSLAQAELHRFELDQKREMADLYRKLDAAQTPEDRARIEQQIAVRQSAMSGRRGGYGGARGPAGESLAQQVAAARALLGDLDATDEEKAGAREFLNAVMGDALAARKGGAQTNPAEPKAAGKPGPWDRFKPLSGATGVTNNDVNKGAAR